MSKAAYVGRAGNGTRTHAIQGGEWHYDRPNRSACGRTLTAVEYFQSSREMGITCRSCAPEDTCAQMPAESAVTFRVWHENGDFLGEFETNTEADECARKAYEDCRRNGCKTNGAERTPGKGDFKCGVLNPHGISVQIIEDGQDVSASNYGQYS